MENHLQIKGLHACVEGKEILAGLDLEIPAGEVHAVMGPNGSGKSTLANVIMGNPEYDVKSGSIYFGGESILGKTVDERARMGIFLSFQYPVSLPGISVSQLVKKSESLVNGGSSFASIKLYKKALADAAIKASLSEDMIIRSANEGFSGGEKKKGEILQIEMLKPGFVILDEIDSGLDIDALNNVAGVINGLRDPERAFLIITHYQRILSLIKPDRVHVMKDGRVIKSGDADLVGELEQDGYVNMEAA